MPLQILDEAAIQRLKDKMDAYLNELQGMDTVEYLNRYPNWEAVATPTALILKPRPENPNFSVTDTSKATEALRIEREIPPDMWPSMALDYAGRPADKYLANNEDVILTPDREIKINLYGSSIMLTSVSFKNQLRGFRVSEDHYTGGISPDGAMISIGARLSKYIALSDDGPMEMTEDDVADIMEWVQDEHGNYSGEWKPYVKPSPASEATEDGVADIREWTRDEHGNYSGEWKPYVKAPPAPVPAEEDASAITPEPEHIATPVIASVSAKQPSTEDGHGKAKASPVIARDEATSRPWIYIGGILLLLAIATALYLRHKK